MSRTATAAQPRLAFVELSATAQLAALVALGVATAVFNAFFKRGLGIGGSAIVWTVIPTMLGMAALPRRFAGTTIAGAAALTALGLLAVGAPTVGPAATTGFVATGLFADWIVSRARPGLPLYIGLTLAGLAANVCAFGAHLVETAVRVVPGVSAARPWPMQIASYAMCGAAAGLLAAAIAYQLRAKK